MIMLSSINTRTRTYVTISRGLSQTLLNSKVDSLQLQGITANTHTHSCGVAAGV